MKDLVKHYSNDEITIVWKPSKCIHAAECVKALPNVYDPKAKPWIKIENATTAELKDQIAKCPSGALSYFVNGEPQKEEIAQQETKITVMQDGPILVHGNVAVELPDGNKENKDSVTAFCRCGASGNKPYCDGSHSKVDFKG